MNSALMGRKQGFGVAVHETPSFFDRTRSPCTKTKRRATSQNSMVWVPKIASWEKEFCEKVGLFRWDNFLEAKKATRFSRRVLEWNDSAAEEAFHRSKNRFFAAINGIQIPDDDVSTPDLYIDDIHWDDDESDDSELHVGLEHSVSDVEDEEEEEDGIGNPNANIVRIEDIQPTGWDCKVEDFSPANILTGQIIGY